MKVVTSNTHDVLQNKCNLIKKIVYVEKGLKCDDLDD